MTTAMFSPTEGLKITPSKSSSPDDFDFYVGKWQIHNRKLNTRLNNCSEWTKFEAEAGMHKIA